MGAVVVTVVAIAIMLLAAAFVSVLRVMAAVRQLTAAVTGIWRQMEPMVTELRENGEIAALEAAQLQSSLEALRARRNGQH